jgi:hypothetical protein
VVDLPLLLPAFEFFFGRSLSRKRMDEIIEIRSQDNFTHQKRMFVDSHSTTVAFFACFAAPLCRSNVDA